MADLDDKVIKTKTGFLDELLGGLHDAVVSAQRLVEKQHIDMVDLYFDDDTGQPLTMEMKIPSSHPDKDFENISVPLFTLAPLSSIKIKDLEMKFIVKLGELLDTLSELAKSMKHNFKVDIGYSESADLYGWKDQKNFKGAVSELTKHVLKSIAPYAKALEIWKQKSRMFHDDKDKIFNKWRKKDGSEQYD